MGVKKLHDSPDGISSHRVRIREIEPMPLARIDICSAERGVMLMIVASQPI